MQSDIVLKTKFIDLVKNSKHIAVIPSNKYDVDSFSAGCGLYYILKDYLKRNGVENGVSFVYPGVIPTQCIELIKKEEVISDLGYRELNVTIDYSNTIAEKVHYNTDNGVLFLKISPIDKSYDKNRIKTEISGYSFDLIITVGVSSITDLENMCPDIIDDIHNNKLVVFDNKNNSINAEQSLVDVASESLCLHILRKSTELDLPLGNKAGKALLTGIANKP